MEIITLPSCATRLARDGASFPNMFLSNDMLPSPLPIESISTYVKYSFFQLSFGFIAWVLMSKYSFIFTDESNLLTMALISDILLSISDFTILVDSSILSISSTICF